MISDINQLDLSQSYTYADYLTWQFDEAVEVIRGKIFRMPPAPNLNHQRMASRLHGKIFNYLEGKVCEVFHAPFDVRLPLPPHHIKDDKVDTVVQPDICVICDPTKLDSRGCIGAPDWIIEILSPGTASMDLKEKFEVYEHAGVQEYWLVHPHEQTLLIYRRNKAGKYIGEPRPFVKGDVVTVSIWDDFRMDLGKIFPEIIY